MFCPIQSKVWCYLYTILAQCTMSGGESLSPVDLLISDTCNKIWQRKGRDKIWYKVKSKSSVKKAPPLEHLFIFL